MPVTQWTILGRWLGFAVVAVPVISVLVTVPFAIDSPPDSVGELLGLWVLVMLFGVPTGAFTASIVALGTANSALRGDWIERGRRRHYRLVRLVGLVAATLIGLGLGGLGVIFTVPAALLVLPLVPRIVDPYLDRIEEGLRSP